MTIAIRLRQAIEADVEAFFEHQRDPIASQMAAFTARDPSDRGAFVERWRRLLDDDTTLTKTIVVDGKVAGHVACFERSGFLEVTYWLGREYWGRGLATVALGELLREIQRPVFARVAKDNLGSIRVLEKCGFKLYGEEQGFANSRHCEIDELLMRLD